MLWAKLFHFFKTPSAVEISKIFNIIMYRQRTFSDLFFETEVSDRLINLTIGRATVLIRVSTEYVCIDINALSYNERLDKAYEKTSLQHGFVSVE